MIINFSSLYKQNKSIKINRLLQIIIAKLIKINISKKMNKFNKL